MTTEQILILAGVVVLVLVALGVAAWVFSSRKRQRQQKLRDRYGREYDETVESKGRKAGEDDLSHREEERQRFDLRDPGDSMREELRQRMAELQFRFVEEPAEVVLEVQRVMVDGLRARGYPVAEDRQRTFRLLSVDHPEETPPLRALLGGNYGRDLPNLHRLFLDARSALLSVLDVSYTQRDLDGTASLGASTPREPSTSREPSRPREPSTPQEPAREPAARPEREPSRDEGEREPRPMASSEPRQSPPGAYRNVESGPSERRV